MLGGGVENVFLSKGKNHQNASKGENLSQEGSPYYLWKRKDHKEHVYRRGGNGQAHAKRNERKEALQKERGGDTIISKNKVQKKKFRSGKGTKKKGGRDTGRTKKGGKKNLGKKTLI